MELILKHGVEYDVVEPVAIEDIVKSLEAHARLARAAATLLAEIIPGLNVETKRVSVTYLSQQSPLKELFAITIVGVYQKDLEKEVPALIEAFTGKALPDQYDTLVTVLAMIVAIYGVNKAFELVFPGKSKSNIEEAKKGLLARASEILKVSVDRISSAVEVLFTGRNSRPLMVASQKVFAPTRGHADALLRDSAGRILVGKAATQDAQAAAGLPVELDDDDKPETYVQFHQNVRIVLHAMDKDRKKTGWAGHCPDLFDERIPMHLEKTLRPEAIFGKDEIEGNILLTSEQGENGEMTPKEFLLIHAFLT